MSSESDTETRSLEPNNSPNQSQHAIAVDDKGPEYERGAWTAVREYLMTNGWKSTEGDNHFKKQRQTADKVSDKNTEYFYTMMKTIAKDLDKATGALKLRGIANPSLLDMCTAPGGFVEVALSKNPSIRVRAMSLPVKSGGHEIRLTRNTVNVELRDITTLAGDMGLTKDDIPTNFPGPYDFLFANVFDSSEKFDLVFCDGQVLRTHQRAEWREPREAGRLTLTQLALGLEHLNSGGTMVILLHKLDSWRCFELIHQFSRMARVQLFKHPRSHKMRSSFYLVAKNIQADGEYAKQMVASWKQKYRIATFGTDEEYAKMHQVSSQTAQMELEKFGKEYIALGRNIWRTQADGLENASFMKNE
ncbi:methyltransferase family [Fusarium heterosporum]|uniref:Methyltransferase family n=1 Tax=Fusarium heterosporum TaxID=42747 RepID=A0A8H5X115_FUSHE|nr:methyltransferase family [Fusarium heterosporum]